MKWRLLHFGPLSHSWNQQLFVRLVVFNQTDELDTVGPVKHLSYESFCQTHVQWGWSRSISFVLKAAGVFCWTHIRTNTWLFNLSDLIMKPAINISCGLSGLFGDCLTHDTWRLIRNRWHTDRWIYDRTTCHRWHKGRWISLQHLLRFICLSFSSFSPTRKISDFLLWTKTHPHRPHPPPPLQTELSCQSCFTSTYKNHQTS